MSHGTDDVRIEALKPLITPEQVHQQHPANPAISDQIAQSRMTIEGIIHGKDKRLLVILGPCSIHDPKAALDYASKLAKVMPHFEKTLCLVMRVYFEKPRTSTGWKGLINDPHLNGSFDINQGLLIARKLLLDIAQQGVATASEFLDSISPQYTADLVCWGAIGARTTESQLHRELASGLSMPLGFKNGTDGNVQIAIDAIHAATQPHHFLGITKAGSAAIVSTAGNNAAHLILRGSKLGPNYTKEDVTSTIKALTQHAQHPNIMIDCSHGNSNQDHQQQPHVAANVAQQIAAGNENIVGVMLESHLKEGKQALHQNTTLNYGQSITDACLSWEDTLEVLNTLSDAVKLRQRRFTPTAVDKNQHIEAC
jgi:3-deoxy-7-phosphoheptulonate synthase